MRASRTETHIVGGELRRMGLGLCLVVFFVTFTACMVQNNQLEISILSGFSSTLRYFNGTCSWRITINAAGTVIDQEVSVGPQRTLVGGDEGSDSFTLKCVTEEGEKLNAIISTHGKEWITVFTYHVLSAISSGNYPTTIKYNSALCDGAVALEPSISS